MQRLVGPYKIECTDLTGLQTAAHKCNHVGVLQGL